MSALLKYNQIPVMRDEVKQTPLGLADRNSIVILTEQFRNKGMAHNASFRVYSC